MPPERLHPSPRRHPRSLLRATIVVICLAVGGQVAASAAASGGRTTVGGATSASGPTVDGAGGRVVEAVDASGQAPRRGRPAHLLPAVRPLAAEPVEILAAAPRLLAENADPIVFDAYRAAAEQWPAMGCRGGWPILAAIGHVESGHGRVAGPETTIGLEGTISPGILGPPLDGGGFALISDTDEGRLDGDTTYDRAVGPMQFIPSTWSRHQRDGNGDGQADPHNIFDAALTAAEYLCRARQGDFRTEAVLASAVRAYNDSDGYVRLVLDLVDWYETGRMGTRTAAAAVSASGPGGSDAADAPASSADAPRSEVALEESSPTPSGASREPLGALSAGGSPADAADPAADGGASAPTGSSTTSSTTTSTSSSTTTSTTVPPVSRITVADLVAAEGDDPAPHREWLVVRIEEPSDLDVELEWETRTLAGEPDEAVPGEDFVSGGGRVVIESGALAVQLPIDVLGDGIVEGDERFVVAISPVSPGVQLAGGAEQAIVTIIDDDLS